MQPSRAFICRNHSRDSCSDYFITPLSNFCDPYGAAVGENGRRDQLAAVRHSQAAKRPLSGALTSIARRLSKFCDLLAAWRSRVASGGQDARKAEFGGFRLKPGAGAARFDHRPTASEKSTRHQAGDDPARASRLARDATGPGSRRAPWARDAVAALDRLGQHPRAPEAPARPPAPKVASSPGRDSPGAPVRR